MAVFHSYCVGARKSVQGAWEIVIEMGEQI